MCPLRPPPPNDVLRASGCSRLAWGLHDSSMLQQRSAPHFFFLPDEIPFVDRPHFARPRSVGGWFLFPGRASRSSHEWSRFPCGQVFSLLLGIKRGPQGNWVFRRSRNCQGPLQSSCPIRSPPSEARGPGFPTSSPALAGVSLLLLAVPVGVRWGLPVVPTCISWWLTRLTSYRGSSAVWIFSRKVFQVLCPFLNLVELRTLAFILRELGSHQKVVGTSLGLWHAEKI